MVDENLIKSLVKNKVIQKNTKFEILVEIKSHTGSIMVSKELLINRFIKKNGVTFLELYDPIKQKEIIVKPSDVISIDGMEPSILADAYDLLPNGDKKVRGKTRGRPRKYLAPIPKSDLVINI